MPPISDVVTVSITRETKPLTQAGFGTLLIAGEAGVFPEVDVVTITMSTDFVADNSIVVTVNGTALTAVPWDTDHDTTIAAVATAIQALDEVATASASGRVITVTGAAGETVVVNSVVVTGGASQPTATIARTPSQRIAFYTDADDILDAGFSATDGEYLAAVAALSQNPSPTRVAIGAKWSGDADWATALAAIKDASNDWFALVAIERDSTNVAAIAAWCESARKLFGTASHDTEILGTGSSDIAATLQAAAYDWSFVLFHPDAWNTYPEAAWMGKLLPYLPGQATWAFKTLAGVAVTELSATQSTNAHSKNCGTYEAIGGANVTREGKVASGEFIDTIRGSAWLEVRLGERIYALVIRSPKLPFTDAGGAAIESEVRAVLDQGIANGFIAENTDPDKYDGRKYYVFVPKVADISVANKANRIFPDVSFTATIAGAIHKVQVAGTIEV